MNTRNLYHSLLWISAASIAVLGFLLIQSRQRTVALDARLQAERIQSMQDCSKSPDEILRAAQLLLSQRSKWSAADIAVSRYDVSYLGSKSGGKWVVVVHFVSAEGWCSYYPELLEMHFTKSGKLIRYFQPDRVDNIIWKRLWPETTAARTPSRSRLPDAGKYRESPAPSLQTD